MKFTEEMSDHLAKISADNGARKIINRMAEEIQRVQEEHVELKERMSSLEDKDQ